MHADIVNRENVWMVQCARGLRFLFKSPQAISILRERCQQNFDRDIAIQFLIARAIHLAHAARTELRANLVAAKFCAGSKTHWLKGWRVIALLSSTSHTLSSPQSRSASQHRHLSKCQKSLDRLCGCRSCLPSSLRLSPARDALTDRVVKQPPSLCDRESSETLRRLPRRDADGDMLGRADSWG